MAGTSTIRQFVGRREQLTSLEQRYQAAASGHGGVVLIAGESGSGKSRLAFEMCSRLAPAGARCAVGQCLEYAQSPYAPLRAALTALAADAPNVLAAAPALRSTLANVIPELDDVDKPRASEPDKLDQLNAIVEALRRFGEQHPVFIVVEDIHWADRASLELLQHFALRANGLRVLIAVTVRTEELQRNHALRSLIAKLARLQTFERIDLAPLPRSDMHELVFNAAGERTPLSESTLSAICARAEGNPLFAEELLKTVVESGNVDADRLPATLREAILDRFATLDGPDKTIVTHAAVLGRRFKPELLAQIVDTPLDKIISAMKRAIDLSLINEESDGDVRFAFRHELTRAAIYGELLVAEASRLHASIANALEAAGSGAHEAELAFHWWQAREPAKASVHFERAGDAATAMFAYRDALVNYERALQYGSDDGAQRAVLNLKLGTALHQCGLEARALRAVEDALQYYESIGDRQAAAAACLRLAFMRTGYGDADVGLELTQKSIELIRDDPTSPVYFDAHMQMMRFYSEYRWEPERFREHMDLARRAVDAQSGEKRSALLRLSITLASSFGRTEEALTETREAVALALHDGDVRSAALAWGHLAIDLSEAGEVRAAAAAFDAVVELEPDKALSGLTATWLVMELARAKLLAGDLEKARAFISQALAADIALPVFRIYAARTGIPLALLLEDESLLRRSAQKGLVEFALRASSCHAIAAASVFAEQHFAQGRAADAAALLKRTLDALDRVKAKPAVGAADDCMIAVARIGGLEDVPVARQFLERTVNSSKVRSSPAMLALFDAFAAKRSGDQTRLKERADEAAVAFRDIGWPLYEAQALELARKFSEALEIYKRIGAVREAKRLDPIVNPVNRRGRTKGELTAREQQICDLLVLGKTNKAIAEKLVLSERTVESHVSSILMKLDVSSRAELIAKLRG